MNYITTIQAANKWGITSRRVLNLIKTNRIPEAIQIGSQWMIPENTQKPKDGRYKEIKENKKDDIFFRYPSFDGIDINDFNPPLSNIEIDIKKTSSLFHECRFEEAKLIIEELTNKEMPTYLYVYVLYVSCLIHIYTNNCIKFKDNYNKLTSELKKDFPRKKEMSSLIYEIDENLGLVEYTVKKFDINSNYQYHESFYAHLASLCFMALFNSGKTNISEKDLIPYEYICKTLENKGYYADLQNIHLCLGNVYGLIANIDKMVFHYKKMFDLTQKYNLFYLPASTYFFYSKAFDEALISYPEDFKNKIKRLSNDVHTRFLQFSNSTISNNFYSLLKNKDYIYILLANQGYSNKEVARIIDTSESNVANKYSAIYGSLNVKNKNELVNLYKQSIIRSLNKDIK